MDQILIREADLFRGRADLIRERDANLVRVKQIERALTTKEVTERRRRLVRVDSETALELLRDSENYSEGDLADWVPGSCAIDSNGDPSLRCAGRGEAMSDRAQLKSVYAVTFEAFDAVILTFCNLCFEAHFPFCRRYEAVLADFIRAGATYIVDPEELGEKWAERFAAGYRCEPHIPFDANEFRKIPDFFPAGELGV